MGHRQLIMTVRTFNRVMKNSLSLRERAGARAKHCNNGPHPRPPVPDAVYRLHPWRRVLLPEGEGTQQMLWCALFAVLLSNTVVYQNFLV